MAPHYDLPHDRSPSPLLRNLLVWGLPLLAWGLLIFGWMLFSGSDDGEDNKKDAPTEARQTPPMAPTAGGTVAAQTGTSGTPTPSAPTAAPAIPSSMSTATAPTTTTGNTPRPQAVTGSAFPSAPYDFSGAPSYIGLPKESACGTGILVDPKTRKVLWAKAADRPVPIASMTKMMTLLLAEEAIAAGAVSRSTVIPVTVEAYKIGGSQVWLDPKESFPLQELLKAVAIKSANDAAYLVGEYLGSGDIGAFVRRMNERAKAIGLTHTIFYDAHGLGDALKRNNKASAHDMIILGERLLGYPETMKMSATRMDTFRNGKTELRNHNNLVFNRVNGVDGLKTGYTNASGFCVTFSCLRGGRRLLGCVTGFKSPRDRDAFCKALLSWGYTR